ncbi:hypothetical protein [Salinispora arenicola]|uniref:hypothetical protein n=1 Tax=Salinispora arenicola TaxID=168697 RepID=UPI0003A414AC|nr:hypothetical protein [Salinispora arenicola]
MTHPISAVGPDHQERDMDDNVVPLRRPKLDAKAAELRAAGLIGAGAGAGAVSGEVLPAQGSAWDRIRTASQGPVLPVWLRDRTVAGQRARWLVLAAGRYAARGVVASPVVVWRCAPPVGRGIRRAVRAWLRWARASALFVEAAELRREGASTAAWEAARERARRSRAGRIWVATVGVPAASLGVWAVGLAVGPLLWVGIGSAVVLAAGIAGRRPGEQILPTAAGPARPVELGMPAGQLHATIAAVMRGLRLDVTVLRSQAHPWGWDVQVMAGQALGKVADKVDEIEARLRTRAGAVSVIPDPQDAGMAVLRVVWSDPYASMPAPARREPRAVSARGQHPIGRMLDGADLRLPLLAHTVYVGKSRSGKSSAVWTVLDILTAANDVVVWGGDLSDAPALNIWGDCVQHYRSSAAGLEGLLKAAIAIGMARAAVMGRRLRPTTDSRPGEDVSENWEPTPEGPALVLVLDEYPLIVEAGLGGLVEEFLRTAAKGAGFAHIASQRAGRTEMGTTTIKTMAVSKVLLACEAGDIEMLMGPGKRAEGWRPDRLKPAADGKPNDAGRCYVDGPGHTEPRLSAVYRLSATEVRDRAIERLQHMQANGRPVIDEATWNAADAYARRRWDASLDELLTADDVAGGDGTQEQSAVPAVLADLRAVLADAEVDAMHTREVLPALAARDDRYAGWSSTDLADAVRPTGLTPAQLRNVRGVANANGYRLSDITTAIARATAV